MGPCPKTSPNPSKARPLADVIPSRISPGGISHCGSLSLNSAFRIVVQVVGLWGLGVGIASCFNPQVFFQVAIVPQGRLKA